MSDDVLRDEIEALKTLLDHQGYEYDDGADAEVLRSVEEMLDLPAVYVRFLEQINPGESLWRIGDHFVVQLYAADTLPDFQTDAWNEQQIIIGAMNEVPLALEMEGAKELDSPIYRLDEEGKSCVGSSLVQFVKILRTGLEMLGKKDEIPVDTDELPEDAFDDINDYDTEAFASAGPEEQMSDYLDELEAIDPDSLDAWAAV